MAFARAISEDYGNRSLPETVLGEVVPTLDGIGHAIRELPRWMRPQRRRVGLRYQPGRAWVEYQPLGCVGVISPWNYPLLLSLSPLTDALAAGNRVILKPSETTPRFSALLARVLADVFDPAQVAVVTGGPEVAQALCALPLDHLLFTGSTAVGRQVMAAAAANLTPVTLELGGKSPVIVCPDHDLAAAARIVAAGKFYNAGQTCIAPDYALVPHDRVAPFASAMMRQIGQMFPAVAGNPDYTSIVSDRHYARLSALLQDAEQRGARVMRWPGAAAERRFGPALVLDPPPDAAVMQEEIFGPILPIIGTPDLAGAIRYVAQRPRPLALYILTNDPAARRKVLAQTVSGGVTVNGTILHCVQHSLPFGGVGASGMGAYHGHEGFKRLSHARGIYQPGRFSGFTWLLPPHGRSMRVALRLMAGRLIDRPKPTPPSR